MAGEPEVNPLSTSIARESSAYRSVADALDVNRDGASAGIGDRDDLQALRVRRLAHAGASLLSGAKVPSMKVSCR